jgi:hypothetical protein
MSAIAAIRFTSTAGELQALARTVPGLVLPSFVAGPRPPAEEAPAVPRYTPDPRLLLAVGLHGAAEGVVQAVCWSPGEVGRRTIAVAGAVSASISRRDAVDLRVGKTVAFEVALLPTAAVAAELGAAVPALDGGPGRGTTSPTVGVVASRAIVEAARHGDPALVEQVAADLRVHPDAAGMLHGFGARQSRGFRARCFDARTGRCVAGDDWFGSEHGWRRLRLGLAPSRGSGTTARELLEEGTLSLAEATDAEIRRSLTMATGTLLRVIAL